MSQCRQQLLKANQCGNSNICCTAEDRLPTKEELLAGIDAHLKHNYGVKRILQNAKAGQSWNHRFLSNESRINQNQYYNMECGQSSQQMTDCGNVRVTNSATQIGSSLYNLCNTGNSQCGYEPANLESCVDLRTAHQNILSLKKTSPKTRAQTYNKYSKWLNQHCQRKPSSECDNNNLKIEIEPQQNLNSIQIKIDSQKKAKSKGMSGSVSKKTFEETCPDTRGIKAKKSSTIASPRSHQMTKKKLLDKTASSAMKYAKLSEEILRYTKQLKSSKNPSKQCFHMPSEIQTRDSDFSEMQNDINNMKNKTKVKHRISIHNHDTYIVLNENKSSTKDESKKIESNDRSSVMKKSSECTNLSKSHNVETRRPSIVIDDSTYVVPQNSEENEYLILPYLAITNDNLEDDQTQRNPDMSEKSQAQQRGGNVPKSMPKKDSQIKNPEVMNSTDTSNPMESTWDSHINQKLQYNRKEESSNTKQLKKPKLNDPCSSNTVEKNSRRSSSQPLRENTYLLMSEKFMESQKDVPKDTDLVTEKNRKQENGTGRKNRNDDRILSEREQDDGTKRDHILVQKGCSCVNAKQPNEEEIISTLDLESLSLDLEFTNRSSEAGSPRIEISRNKYSEQKRYYEQQLHNFRNENTQTSNFQSCRNSALGPISEGSQSRSDSDPKQSKNPKPNNVGYSRSSFQSRTPREKVVASHNETLKQSPRSVLSPKKYTSAEDHSLSQKNNVKRSSTLTPRLTASNIPRGNARPLQNLTPRPTITQKPQTSNTPRGSAKSNEYLTPRRMEPKRRISAETKHPKVELENKRIDTPRRASKTSISIHNKSTDNKYRNEKAQTSSKCGKKGELRAISEVTKSRSETVPKQSQNPKSNNGSYSSSRYQSRTPRVPMTASWKEIQKKSPRSPNRIPKKYASEDHSSSQKNTSKRSSTMTQKPQTSNTPRGSAKSNEYLTPRRMEPKRKISIETKHPKVEEHKTWNDTLCCCYDTPKTSISIQNKSIDNKCQNENTQRSNKSDNYSESDAISKESKSRSNSVGYSNSSRRSRSPKIPIAPSNSPQSPRTPSSVPKKYGSEDHSSSQKNNVKRSSTMAQKVLTLNTAKYSAKSSEYITPKPTEPKRSFSIETKHPTIEVELENTCNDNQFGDTSLISISIHNEPADNNNCGNTLHLKCFPECTVDDGKTKINTKENTFIMKSKIKTSVPISSSSLPSPSKHIKHERPSHSEYGATSKTDETDMIPSPKEVSPKLRYSETRSRSSTTTNQKSFNPEHIKQETYIHERSSDETEMISTPKEVPPKLRYSESGRRSTSIANQDGFDLKHIKENSSIHGRSSHETGMISSTPKQVPRKIRYSESRSKSTTTMNQKRFNLEPIKQRSFIHERSSDDEYAIINETEMISTPKEVSPEFRYSESRSRSTATTNQKRFDPKRIEENNFIHETEMNSTPREVSPKFRYSESRSRSTTTTSQKRFDPEHIKQETFIYERSSDEEYAIIDKTEMISTPKEVPPKLRYSESRSRSTTTTNQNRFDPEHIEQQICNHERSSDDGYAISEKTNENNVQFRSTTQTNSDLALDRESRKSTGFESLERTARKTKTKDCNCQNKLQNNVPVYEAASLNNGNKELLPPYAIRPISKSSSEYSMSLQNELNLQAKITRSTLSKSFEMIPNPQKSNDNDENTIPAETLQETLSRVVGADNSDSSDVNSRRLNSALEEASKLTSGALNEISKKVENLNRNNDVNSGRLSSAFQRTSKITTEIKQEVDTLKKNDDGRRITPALQRATKIKAETDNKIKKEVELLTNEIQAVFSQLDVVEEQQTVSFNPELPSKRISSNISPSPYMAKIPPINLSESNGTQSEEQTFTPGHPLAEVPQELAELIHNLQKQVKTCDAKLKKQTEIIEKLKCESAMKNKTEAPERASMSPKPLKKYETSTKDENRDHFCTCCNCEEDQDDQLDNLSDSSDEIPPFTGCECMREDYYAIMRIAYNKR